MTEKALHMRGVRIGGAIPREPWLPDDRPAFFTDPARRCAPTNPDWQMWTAEGRTERYLAARLCRQDCPFVTECRQWAAANGEVWGAWGGVVMRDPTREPKPAPGTPGDGLNEQDLVAKTLEGNDLKFALLTKEQQTAVVRGGLARGWTWARLARRTKVRIAELQQIADETGPTLDERVREMNGRGLPDTKIAEVLGVSVTTVRCSRDAQNLPRVVQVCNETQQRVRQLWEQGLSDGEIALRIDRHPSIVRKYRVVLGLPSKLGPGRPRRKEVAA